MISYSYHINHMPWNMSICDIIYSVYMLFISSIKNKRPRYFKVMVPNSLMPSIQYVQLTNISLYSIGLTKWVINIVIRNYCKTLLECYRYNKYQSISISPLEETLFGRSKNCQTNYENFEKWRNSTRVSQSCDWNIPLQKELGRYLFPVSLEKI